MASETARAPLRSTRSVNPLALPSLAPSAISTIRPESNRTSSSSDAPTLPPLALPPSSPVLIPPRRPQGAASATGRSASHSNTIPPIASPASPPPPAAPQSNAGGSQSSGGTSQTSEAQIAVAEALVAAAEVWRLTRRRIEREQEAEIAAQRLLLAKRRSGRRRSSGCGTPRAGTPRAATPRSPATTSLIVDASVWRPRSASPVDPSAAEASQQSSRCPTPDILRETLDPPIADPSLPPRQYSRTGWPTPTEAALLEYQFHNDLQQRLSCGPRDTVVIMRKSVSLVTTGGANGGTASGGNFLSSIYGGSDDDDDGEGSSDGESNAESNTSHEQDPSRSTGRGTPSSKRGKKKTSQSKKASPPVLDAWEDVAFQRALDEKISRIVNKYLTDGSRTYFPSAHHHPEKSGSAPTDDATTAANDYNSRPSSALARDVNGTTAATSAAFLRSKSNHVIDYDEKVMLRMWASRKEAKRFQRGMSAVHQTLHMLMLPSCFAAVFTVLVHVDDCSLTLTWLPPIRSEEPLKIRDKTNRVNILRFVQRTVDYALKSESLGKPGFRREACSPKRQQALTAELQRYHDPLIANVTTLTSAVEGVDGRYYFAFRGMHLNTIAATIAAASPRSDLASGGFGSMSMSSSASPTGAAATSPNSSSNRVDGPVWAAVDMLHKKTASQHGSHMATSPRHHKTTVRDQQAATSPRCSGNQADQPLLFGFPACRLPVHFVAPVSTQPNHTTQSGVQSPLRERHDHSSTDAAAGVALYQAQYQATKQLFQCASDDLGTLHRLYGRSVGSVRADVPPALTALHSVLVYISGTQYLRGALLSLPASMLKIASRPPSSERGGQGGGGGGDTSDGAMLNAMRQQWQRVKAAVDNLLNYAKHLSKEETPLALLFYVIAGEVLPLSTVHCAKRMAKKVSNVSLLQQSVAEWEHDCHALEHISMRICLHLMECHGLRCAKCTAFGRVHGVYQQEFQVGCPEPPRIGLPQS